MTTPAREATDTSWQEANYFYLLAELQRLRLLLRRRVLWLRTQWAGQTAADQEGLAIGHAEADRLLAGEDVEAEARFYQRDPQAVQVGRSLAALETDLSRRLSALRSAATPPPLDSVARLFDLTEIERETVLLCLAPHLDPSFERLYGYVQDDATRRHVTPALVSSLFPARGASDPTLWHSFQPHAPLRRFRLLTTAEAGSLCSLPLVLADRVVAYLLGFNRGEERIAEMLRRPEPVAVPPRQREQAEALARWAAAGLARGVWPRLNLAGPPGSGRGALAQSLCSNLGLGLQLLDLRRLASGSPELAYLLEREAVLTQCAFHLDITDLDPVSDASSLRCLSDLMARLHAFLVLSSREPWPGDLLCAAVERPTPEEQYLLWQGAMEDLGPSEAGPIEAIVEQFDLGPATIAAGAVRARNQAGARAGPGAPITLQDLREACRSAAGAAAGGLAHPVELLHSWNDLVLPTSAHQQLREIVDQVENRARVYRDWGFGPRLGRGRGISVLFSGPSGTGKTMAASILARHLDLALYRIDLSSVVSKYIGETEKNLRHVFDAAEHSGAILFFDEADALFGKRTEVRDSHDRYANVEIDYLLQRMEEYRGLAILATNMKSHLDQAFLRRLRFVVEFPFPDPEQRRLIWQKAFPPAAPLEGLRYDLLARLELSGGNIRNIAVNAAFLAAQEEAAIGMGHVMRAAGREYAKEERLVTAAEFGPYYQGGLP